MPHSKFSMRRGDKCKLLFAENLIFRFDVNDSWPSLMSKQVQHASTRVHFHLLLDTVLSVILSNVVRLWSLTPHSKKIQLTWEWVNNYSIFISGWAICFILKLFVDTQNKISWRGKHLWILMRMIHVMGSALISTNRSVMFLHTQHSQYHNHPMALKSFMNGHDSQWPVSTKML